MAAAEQPVIYEPHLLHPLTQDEGKKPYERQEGESPKWFWRFRNYLSLGPKRSINAAFEIEHKSKQLKSRTNAGPEWYAAAKRFRWLARAEAYDAQEEMRKAAIMRTIAAKCAMVSRPYRIVQLQSLAEGILRRTEEGMDPATYLAMTRQVQSLMAQIEREVADWNVSCDSTTDASALDTLALKNERMAALAKERDAIQEEEFDRMLSELERSGRI